MPFNATFARPSNGIAGVAKTIKAQDGKLSVSAMVPAKEWVFEVKTFETFQDFQALILHYAQEQRYALVRGLPRPLAQGAKTMRRRLKADFEGWSNVITFDLDSISLPGASPKTEQDHADLARWLYDQLPEPWGNSGAVVQFTSSMGIKSGLRARVWIATEQPLSYHEIEQGFHLDQNPATLALKSGAVPVDKLVWRAHHPNFLADPILEGDIADPVPGPRFYTFGSAIVPASATEPYTALLPEDPYLLTAGEVPENFPGVDHPTCIAGMERYLADLSRKGGLLRDNRHMGFLYAVWAGMDRGCSQDTALDRTLEWCHELNAAGQANMPDFDPETMPHHFLANQHGRKDQIGIKWIPEQLPPDPLATNLAIDVSGEEDEAEAETDGPDMLDPFAGRLYRFPGDGGEDIQPSWILDDVLADFQVAAIIGPTRSGKSFVAVDLALALSTGDAWMGKHQVREPGGTIILAAEAEGSIYSRIEAGLQARDLDPRSQTGGRFDNSVVVARWDVSAETKMVKRLLAIKQQFDAAHARPLRYLVLDTVSALEAGKADSGYDNENDNAQAAKVVAKYRTVARKTGLRFIFVHHTGKNAAAGSRGANAWTANVDAQITVHAEMDEISGRIKGDRTLAVTKTKGAEGGLLGTFSIANHYLGRTHSQTGKRLTVGVFTTGPEALPKKTAPGAAQEVLDALLKKQPVSSADLRASLPGVPRTTFFRHISTLTSQGWITEKAGLLSAAALDEAAPPQAFEMADNEEDPLA